MFSDKFIIGHNIEKARKKLKLSTVEMAKKLDCSQQTISAIEKGRAYGKNFTRYLYFLHKEGIDLNELFD